MPVLGLILLIVSFFAAKVVPGARKWAGIVFGLIVLQVALAFVSFGARHRCVARHQRAAHPRRGRAGRRADPPTPSVGGTRGSGRRPAQTHRPALRGRPSLSERPRRRWRRLTVPLVLLVASLATLGWFWWSAWCPSTYSVMEMGYADSGGGPATGTAARTGRQRRRPDRPGPGEPDVAVDLAARQERFALATGEEVDGYTLNGTSPGPRSRRGRATWSR